MTEVNTIIIGQGLAGSCLAIQLLKKREKVLVIDNDAPNTSSKVAAGIVNPLVFKRLTKSWMASELIPYAENFYAEMEQRTKVDFYQKRKIWKIFHSIQEQNDWDVYSEGNKLSPFCFQSFNNPFPNEVDAPFGLGEVHHAGNLNTRVFLAATKIFLQEREAYLKAQIDLEKLVISENGVEFEGISAKRVVFCEGYKATENPHFSWLPFKLAKGELLTLELESKWPTAEIYNKDFFVLQDEGNKVKMGATYGWEDFSLATTESAKEELLEKWHKTIKSKIVNIEQHAGIRPTVRVRRPFLGAHPVEKNVFIFNGLGSKGVMLAPYFSEKMAEHLMEGKALPDEVNITRYKGIIRKTFFNRFSS